MLKLQHHAAVHISVTFGIVSHFSIALQDAEDVLIIVVFSKNTLLQVASTLLEVFIIDDLTNVPNPFEEKLHVVTICGLNNLTLSTELVNVDAGVMLELP